MTSSISGFTKYKDRISMYEDSSNPIAPLTNEQQEFLVELTHGEFHRPIPQNLKPLQKQNGINPVENRSIKEDESNVDWTKFDFTNKQEFSCWYSNLEKDLETRKDATAIEYIQCLTDATNSTSILLTEISKILEELKLLQENYHFVSNKTNSLHESCQQLIQEKLKLESTSAELDLNLSYFLKFERIASKLSSSNLIIPSDNFFSLLEQIDTCLSFMIHNPTYRESSVYTAKYKHCLNKAISLIKSYVHRNLQEATEEIKSSVQFGTSGKEALFPLVYGKFSASIAKLNRIFNEIEDRRNGLPEYSELFSELQEAYFQERSSLLSGSVFGIVEEINVKGRTGFDLCSTVRLAASFCIHLSQDEFRIFKDFFNPSFTIHFDEFLNRLCTPIYDSLRPLIIKVQHLETLAELCHIFRTELMEEHGRNPAGVSSAGNPTIFGLSSFLNILQQLLQDTQERLVYRASIYIASDIRNFTPSDGDLAYPQKLQMMEEIAQSLGGAIPPNSTQPLLKRTNSQSSLNSTSSLEVAQINSQLTIPRPLKAASSPADLHGMWYPSVRRTLLCLSKLYRSLDKAIFQGLSQEALSACIVNLSEAAAGISSKSSLTDAFLFEIKHLLILREQIAPFQAEFAVRETALDFSRVKTAAFSLLQKKKQLFSLTGNNALLEFILEGTPQVREYFLDSKKDVDRQLKSICEQFINHSTQLLIGNLLQYLKRVTKFSEAQKVNPAFKLNEQPFSTVEKIAEIIQETLENFQTKLPFLHRSMKLYLANRETEFILFRPIKNNVLNGFLELESVLRVEFNEKIACPSQEHLNALLSSLVIMTTENS